MSDDEKEESEKTEEPSQRRIDDAINRGQVIFSREMTNFALLLALTLVIVFLLPTKTYETGVALSYYIDHAWDVSLDAISLRHLFLRTFWDYAHFLAAPALFLIGASLSSSLIQNKGLNFSLNPIVPKLEKISLIKGLKRLFSKQSLVEFSKGLIKITIVGWIAYLAVLPHLSKLKEAHSLDIAGMLALLLMMVTNMMIGICIAMFFIAIADYLYQRFQFYKRLRMTKQEVKDEYKQSEGNPEIKSKLRQLRLSRAKKRMMSSVPKADVVITNPTHFSIALRYDTATMRAPVVVAKGMDAVAFIIRDVAKKHDIPVIANPPLARALYNLTEIDQEIPVAYYQAVAEIISYVFNLKNKHFKG
jgi:flagellar biosynthetic protein FlhB